MVKHELIDYIVKFTHRGGTIEQAKNNLVKAGHTKPHVDEAASRVKQKKFQTVGAIVLAIIIIIAIIGLVADKLFEKPIPEIINSYDALLDAIAQGDISACDQFNPVKKDVCRRSILGEVGGGDTSSNIPPEQSIIEQAALLQDPSLCDDIISVVQKENCLIESGAKKAGVIETYIEDPYTGELVPTEYQLFEEITYLAEETGDSSLCDQITNPVKQQRCFLNS